MNTPAKTTQPAKHPLDARLCEELALPERDVLIRKVGGPDGINAHLGLVMRGRVYCLSIEQAVHMLGSTTGEFEAVFKPDRARIEAASKKAQEKAQGKTKTPD